ncbi:MAG: ribbon-helix-helix protein, CopG family [Dermatophilaceae bacterium]
MRTTINLPDELYARLRDRARERGRTVTAELEDAVRARLDTSSARRHRFVVTPFEGTGTRPGVDLDDGSALLDLMDEADLSR